MWHDMLTRDASSDKNIRGADASTPPSPIIPIFIRYKRAMNI